MALCIQIFKTKLIIVINYILLYMKIAELTEIQLNFSKETNKVCISTCKPDNWREII